MNEARTVGEMLIQAADEMTEHHGNLVEGGDNHGNSKERQVEG
jgi:hypothetical protein